MFLQLEHMMSLMSVSMIKNDHLIGANSPDGREGELEMHGANHDA